jgi:succinate dehydrogenase / fumarate reductase cytochrome b subunit
MRVYRDRGGHRAWVLHRLTGLGVLAFLCLHVLDTALLLRGEDAYNHLVRGVYQQWWFQPLEVVLGAALVYHALNGLRLVLVDAWAGGVRYERPIRRTTLALVVLAVAPLAAVMLWPYLSAALGGGT